MMETFFAFRSYEVTKKCRRVRNFALARRRPESRSNGWRFVGGVCLGQGGEQLIGGKRFLQVNRAKVRGFVSQHRIVPT